MSNIQDPPTWASVVDVSSQSFNPVWLQWFIDLAAIVNGSGGSTPTHNKLNGLQGGNSGTSEFYHLTSAAATNANVLSGGSGGQFLASSGGAGSPSWALIDLSSASVTNVLPISKGGTGATSNLPPVFGSPIPVFGVTSTFTPVLAFGGSSTGMTYTTQSALYTAIGDIVYVTINIKLSNKGSSTGTATITGLPHASNSTCISSLAVGKFENIVYGTGVPAANIGTSSSSVNLIAINNNNVITTLSDAQFSNTSNICLSGFYRT